VRRGETEYGIGAIPLGGFVKITGMNPDEKVPPEVEPRAYYKQSVWKRIVVVMAGPLVNVVIAFFLLFGLSFSATELTRKIGELSPGYPAAGILKPGDRIVSVDGKRGDAPAIARQISSHHCADKPRPGCRAQTPAIIRFERNGRVITAHVRPKFSASFKRTLIGFTYATRPANPSAPEAARMALDFMGTVTTATGRAISRIFQSEQRKQLHGAVGIYAVTRNEFAHNVKRALFVVAVVSLSLALFNLFPFFPLDGGHVLLALLEKPFGRAGSARAMMQISALGIAMVVFLAIVAFTNDVGRLLGGGFDTP
jgi:regulator of sigma E protease